MKKNFLLLTILASFVIISCESTPVKETESPAEVKKSTVVEDEVLFEEEVTESLPLETAEKADYAIAFRNYTNNVIKLRAYFYDESDKLLGKYQIGVIEGNSTGVYYFDADEICSLFENAVNPYVSYKSYANSKLIEQTKTVSQSKKIRLSELKYNYTSCHYSKDQNYTQHEKISHPETQKSTSIVYDDTNEFIEFKLYDDLSWLKGKWVKTEGYGVDYFIVKEGSPFGMIENYNNQEENPRMDIVSRWISLNNFSDTFYVNAEKTKLKTSHPFALDPSVLLVSVYEKQTEE